MTGSWLTRAYAGPWPVRVVGGVAIGPVCSACRGGGRLWQLDNRRFRVCRPCLGALMWLAGDIEALARRKAGAV